MFARYTYLQVRDDETKRLRAEFNDNRITFVRNIKEHLLQAWYSPASSSPYMITVAKNVQHAIRLLRNRLQYEKTRAKDLLAKIDAHNDKIVRDKELDAMHEVRSTLRSVASGRQLFTPPRRR